MLITMHAEDVRDYLMTQLKVPEEHIRRKTAEKDELVDEDLLSPYSGVRYILTKDALREGWDCPFAYVLTLLDTTSAERALIQMTGRVLRQPDTELTGRAALDESWIYCFDHDVGRAIQSVKRGLEQEGMGDLNEFVRSGTAHNGAGRGGKATAVPRRAPFRDMQIFLPTVLHRAGKRYRQLDYENDVLGGVNWRRIAAAPLDLDLANKDAIREITALVDLPAFDFDTDSEKLEMHKTLSPEFFSRRIYETLPNPYLAGLVVKKMLRALRQRGHTEEEIFDRRYYLSEMLKRRLAELVEHEAQSLFHNKLQSGEIRFELVTEDDGFELAQELQKVVDENQLPLFGAHGAPLDKSLYERVFAREFNGLEQDFAIYLDGYSAVTWWHRFAARQDYGLQGWKRHRVYPDFIVCVDKGNGKNNARRVMAIETKGLQLAGSADTEYKQKLFEVLETAEPRAVEYGTLRFPKGTQHPMSLRLLFQHNFRDEFDKLAVNDMESGVC